MLRKLWIVVLCGWIGTLSIGSWAQTSVTGAAAQQQHLDDGPILAKVAQINPAAAAKIKSELETLAQPPLPPIQIDLRSLGGATAEEAKELAENPLFAAAYANSPASGIRLFRRAKRIIGSAASDQTNVSR